MANPTNRELQRDINDIKTDLAEMRNEVSELHDFMIRTETMHAKLKTANGSLNWNTILKGLLTFLGTIALVLLGLVQILDRIIK